MTPDGCHSEQARSLGLSFGLAAALAALVWACGVWL